MTTLLKFEQILGSLNFGGTASEGGEKQCIHRWVAPSHGTEVNMIGIRRLLNRSLGEVGASSLIILV